jgi:hypothetical protein
VGAVEGDAEPEAEVAILVGAVLGVIEVEVVSGASLVLYFRSSPCCTLQLQYPPVQGGILQHLQQLQDWFLQRCKMCFCSKS